MIRPAAVSHVANLHLHVLVNTWTTLARLNSVLAGGALANFSIFRKILLAKKSVEIVQIPSRSSTEAVQTIGDSFLLLLKEFFALRHDSISVALKHLDRVHINELVLFASVIVILRISNGTSNLALFELFTLALHLFL